MNEKKRSSPKDWMMSMMVLSAIMMVMMVMMVKMRMTTGCGSRGGRRSMTIQFYVSSLPTHVTCTLNVFMRRRTPTHVKQSHRRHTHSRTLTHTHTIINNTHTHVTHLYKLTEVTYTHEHSRTLTHLTLTLTDDHTLSHVVHTDVTNSHRRMYNVF